MSKDNQNTPPVDPRLDALEDAYNKLAEENEALKEQLDSLGKSTLVKSKVDKPLAKAGRIVKIGKDEVACRFPAATLPDGNIVVFEKLTEKEITALYEEYPTLFVKQ